VRRQSRSGLNWRPSVCRREDGHDSNCLVPTHLSANIPGLFAVYRRPGGLGIATGRAGCWVATTNRLHRASKPRRRGRRPHHDARRHLAGGRPRRLSRPRAEPAPQSWGVLVIATGSVRDEGSNILIYSAPGQRRNRVAAGGVRNLFIKKSEGANRCAGDRKAAFGCAGMRT
jgi:hypothetical protein